MNQKAVDLVHHERSPWGIRAKVFSLVLLSVLLPTALVGTSSYWTARDLLTDKLSGQLNTRAALAAAAATEWFQEREYDARVFASSGIVVGNLDKVSGPSPLTRAYLEEVHGRYPAYEGLSVLDAAGRVVASAGEVADAKIRNSILSVDWQADAAVLRAQHPIRRSDGKISGYFIMLCNFESLRERIAGERSGEHLQIVAPDGRAILAHPPGTESTQAGLSSLQEATITEHQTRAGATLLATTHAVSVPGLDTPLFVHVETERRLAFAAVDRLRNRIILLSAVVAVVVISLAFGLVMSLTRPLESLIEGAQAVSNGDYSRQLRVRTGDEIGYLTEVFNRMTEALEESHRSLHRLSTTDELTKLVNRRQLRVALARTLKHAQRKQEPFSVIMIDIDHFKAFNDKLGHIKGDELLSSLGTYLLENLRATDVAARYGGEEFLVVLPNTELEEAKAKAESIRDGFPASYEGPAKVTLSLGVAVWPRHGDSEKALIDAADRALYSAKKRGRNRVAGARQRAARRTSSA